MSQDSTGSHGLEYYQQYCPNQNLSQINEEEDYSEPLVFAQPIEEDYPQPLEYPTDHQPSDAESYQWSIAPEQDDENDVDLDFTATLRLAPDEEIPPEQRSYPKMTVLRHEDVVGTVFQTSFSYC